MGEQICPKNIYLGIKRTPLEVKIVPIIFTNELSKSLK